jgi:ABC-type uncharacterized transport system auxiliary subunit
MTRTLSLILCLSLILAGCLGRRSIPARYYILDFPPGLEVDINTGPPIQKSCLIRPVNISPAYSTTQIALRERTHEIRYFAFNQWAVRPEQSFTSLLVDFINDQNIFRTIHTRPGLNLEPDYIIETAIHHMVLVEEGRDYYARLSLEYVLRDFINDEIIVNHRADREELLEEKNLNLFAAAISEIFIDELGKFSSAVLADIR